MLARLELKLWRFQRKTNCGILDAMYLDKYSNKMLKYCGKVVRYIYNYGFFDKGGLL